MFYHYWVGSTGRSAPVKQFTVVTNGVTTRVLRNAYDAVYGKGRRVRVRENPSGVECYVS
eukprot:565082-Pyramimonas_sp.AAC.1